MSLLVFALLWFISPVDLVSAEEVCPHSESSCDPGSTSVGLTVVPSSTPTPTTPAGYSGDHDSTGETDSGSGSDGSKGNIDMAKTGVPVCLTGTVILALVSAGVALSRKDVK
jgi:hypothetical protein